MHGQQNIKWIRNVEKKVALFLAVNPVDIL